MKLLLVIIFINIIFSSCAGQGDSANVIDKNLAKSIENSIDFQKRIETGLIEYKNWDNVKLISEAEEIYTRIGVPYYSQDTSRLVIALTFLNRAIELNSNSVDAITDKFNILCSIGQYYEAILVLNSLTSITKHYAKNNFTKGLIYEKINRIDSANNYYKQAFEMYNQKITKFNNVNDKINRAVLLNFVEDNNASLIAIEDIIKQYPNNRLAIITKENIIVNFDRKQFIEKYIYP